MEAKCEVCSTDFHVKPSRAAIGKGRFCSTRCRRSFEFDMPRKFWARTLKTDSCWQWIGPISREGYGRLQLPPANGKRDWLLAHRYAYEMLRGPIPAGLHIDHLCRNRACVNPDHLEPVTCATNVLRGVGIAARNHRKSHCVNGHPLSGANLAPRTAASGNLARECLACRRAKTRRYQDKQKSNRQLASKEQR